MALAELDKLHADGFNETMLASGRNYILGTYTLGLETSPQLAQALGELRFYGQPDEDFNDYARRIAAVSNIEATETIKRVYPTRDDLVFVLTGDGASIRDQIAKYGEVTELSISAPRFRP
jgi:predicted Zn-dependent peptidase